MPSRAVNRVHGEPAPDVLRIVCQRVQVIAAESRRRQRLMATATRWRDDGVCVSVPGCCTHVGITLHRTVALLKVYATLDGHLKDRTQ